MDCESSALTTRPLLHRLVTKTKLKRDKNELIVFPCNEMHSVHLSQTNLRENLWDLLASVQTWYFQGLLHTFGRIYDNFFRRGFVCKLSISPTNNVKWKLQQVLTEIQMIEVYYFNHCPGFHVHHTCTISTIVLVSMYIVIIKLRTHLWRFSKRNERKNS